MKRMLFLVPLLFFAGCEVTEELGMVEFDEKQVLTYERAGTETINVGGRDYKVTKTIGRDPKTGEAFVTLYNTRYNTTPIECIGDVSRCVKEIERLEAADRVGE